MKRIIGLIALLALSQSAFSEEKAAKQSDAMPTAETKLLESDAAAEATPTATMPAETAAASTETMKEEQTGFSRGSVVRSAFTRDIDEREPTENLQNLTNDNNQIKFFTELRDMSGQTATHRWEYDGKVIAEVKFDVKGPRWRVWSSKSFVPQWTGDWKVSVVNGVGDVISEKKLSYDLAKTEEVTETPIESKKETMPTETMQ